jgi:hypothetical protein
MRPDDDLLTRLRAADPAPGPADPPPLEPLLSRARARPAPPSVRARPSRARGWRPLLAGAGLVGAAGALAVLVLAGAGGRAVDPVAEARAAITPRDGEVIHVVVRGGWVQGDGTAVPVILGVHESPRGRRVVLARRWATWSTAQPRRSRRDTAVFDERTGRRVGTLSSGQDATGRGWARQLDGRVDATPRLEELEGIAERIPAGGRPVNALNDADPVAGIRERLERGALQVVARDDDTVTLRGTVAGQRLSNRRGAVPETRTTYVVDADTYAPREITVEDRAPDPDHGTFRRLQRYRIERFERRALDAETRALFRRPRSR